MPVLSIERYVQALSSIDSACSESVTEAISDYATRYPDASLEELRTYAINVASEAVEVYGGAASMAADGVFDDVMTAEGVSVNSQAGLVEPRYDGINRAARYQVGRSETPTDFAREMGKAASYYSRDMAQREMMAQVARARGTRAGRDIRFARVPTGIETCTFCTMLASNGFYYKSADSAGHANHRGCNCVIVPGLDGHTEIEGYDPDALYDRWQRFEEIDAKDNLNDDEKRVLKFLAAEDNMSLNLYGVRERMDKIINTAGSSSLERLTSESKLYDREWVLTGSSPKLSYDSPVTKAKKERDPSHVNELKTAEILREHGFRTVFWDDEWQEDIPNGKGKITKSRGDLDTGVEIKTVYESAAQSTFDSHVRSTKKKAGVTKLVVDISANKKLSDEQARTLISNALRNRRMQEAIMINHNRELERVIPA